MGRTRAVPGGSGGGMPGNGGCTGLAFWRFFSGRGLAIQNHAPSLAQAHRTVLRATFYLPAPRPYGLALPGVETPVNLALSPVRSPARPQWKPKDFVLSSGTSSRTGACHLAWPGDS